MNDFEILKKIVEGKIDIREIDSETKQRLIKMCKQRLEQVEKKIEEKNEQIRKLEEIIKQNS